MTNNTLAHGARIGFAILKSKLFSQQRILTIQLMLNYTCNANCQYCSAPHTNKVMEGERVKEILLQLKKHGTLQVSFAGGEPTIHPQYQEIMCLARQLNFFTTVSSNGINPQPILEAPPEAAPHLVSISLDGSQNLHDIYRGKGTWQKAYSTLEELQKMNIPRTINAVIGKHNCDIEALRELLDYSNKLGANFGFQFMLPRYDAEDQENPLAPDKIQRETLLQDLIALPLKEKRSLIFGDDILRHLLSWDQAYPYYRTVENRECFAGRNFAFIDPDGLLSPCSLLEEHATYKDNNIFEKGFEQALATIQKIPCNDCYLGCNILRNNLLGLRFNVANRVWRMFA